MPLDQKDVEQTKCGEENEKNYYISYMNEWHTIEIYFYFHFCHTEAHIFVCKREQCSQWATHTHTHTNLMKTDDNERFWNLVYVYKHIIQQT